jgi:hypothetical protein
VRWSAQGQLELAKLWRSVNLFVGVPAAFLAAVAGVTALASTTNRIVAGIVALVAAGLGAVAATLDASKRGRQTLHELAATRQEVNARAAAIPRIAYRRARRNIEREGGQTYQADSEE